MPELSVKTLNLKQNGKKIERLSSRTNSVGMELSSIRYSLDWDVKSQLQIDSNIRDLSESLEALSLSLKKLGKFLTNSGYTYESTEVENIKKITSLKTDITSVGMSYKLFERMGFSNPKFWSDAFDFSASLGFLGPVAQLFSILPNLNDMLFGKVYDLGSTNSKKAKSNLKFKKMLKEMKEIGSYTYPKKDNESDGKSKSNNSKEDKVSKYGSLFSIGTGTTSEKVWKEYLFDGENSDGFLKIGVADFSKGIDIDGAGAVNMGVAAGATAIILGGELGSYENDYVGISNNAEVKVLSAEASAKGEFDIKNLDANVKGKIGADVVEGKASTTLKLFGIIEVEAGVSGNIGIGAEAKVGLDDGKVTFGAKAVCGIGGGFEMKIGLGDTAKDAVGSAFEFVKDVFGDTVDYIQSLDSGGGNFGGGGGGSAW